MKYFFIFALALSVFSQSATLEWNYNSNALSQAAPYVFKIYGTNQLGSPAQMWPVLFSGSNVPVVAFDGTNYTFALSNIVFATNGQMFYTATASNFWGESGFSNTSNVPALPTTLQTKIFKN